MALHDPLEAPSRTPSMGALGDVMVEVVAVLGRARLPVRALLALGPGSVVALDRYVGEPVSLEVGGVCVAYGQVVVEDGRFGVRITQLVGSE